MKMSITRRIGAAVTLVLPQRSAPLTRRRRPVRSS